MFWVQHFFLSLNDIKFICGIITATHIGNLKKKKAYQFQVTPLDELLRLLAVGDVDALDQVYRRYYTRLIAYGIQLSGGHRQEDIQDIVQEFFIWLAQNYDKTDQIRDFEAYLFRSIRRNIFLKLGISQANKTKMDRFRRRTESEDDHTSPSPEEAFIRNETNNARQSLVTRELEKLPPYQWEVLYLRYYEGRSYKDIAKILSISDQVARNFASRGIKRLKAQLKDLTILSLLLLLLVDLLFG